MSDDPEKNLELVALFSASAFSNVLQAAYIMKTADAFLHERQDAFRTNPANTLPYQALHAMEEQSVVFVSEVLTDELQQRPLAIELPGLQQLFRHRDMISHPMTVKWRRPDRQEFANARHQWSPVRAGLVWNILKLMNEARLLS